MLGYDEKSEMWRIDVSKAPKDHSGLLGTINDMQKDLSNPGFVKALCIHEAAHEIYWRRIGVDTTPDYNIYIEHDMEQSRCVKIYASVIADLRCLENRDDLDLSSLVQAYASADIAAEILAPYYYQGEEGDYEKFIEFLKFAEVSQPINPKVEWEKARTLVRHEIQDLRALVRQEILLRAVEFERAFRRHSELV